MEKLFYGTNEFKKLAARIAFYNTNRKIPTGQTPIIYDQTNQRVVFEPNGGYAGHYRLYDFMQDKGWDIPEIPEQAHGYFYPASGKFEWYRAPYLVPNPNLEDAFRSGILKATPQPKPKPQAPLCKFKWGVPHVDEEDPTNENAQRPVIYWVNEDTVYLGRPYGMHYEIYEIMEDDGFDPEGSTGEEVHGYWNWTSGQKNFKWYEPGAYGYQANRLPEADEEDRIRATIENVFAQNGVTSKIKRSAAVLNYKILPSDDAHGGGVPWSWDKETKTLMIGDGEGFHYILDIDGNKIGRFMPDTGEVLFYNHPGNEDLSSREEDIVETLRSVAPELSDKDWSGFDKSDIKDQGWDDPYSDFFKLVR